MKKHVKLRSGSTLRSTKTTLNKTVLKSTGVSLNQHHAMDHQTPLCSKSTKLICQASPGSSRLVGDKAECKVEEVFEKANISVNRTRNSGATNCDGDLVAIIKNNSIRIEVKKRNTKDMTIRMDYWDTIEKKSLLHGGIPCLTLCNKEDKLLAVLNLKDLVQLLHDLSTKE